MIIPQWGVMTVGLYQRPSRQTG